MKISLLNKLLYVPQKWIQRYLKTQPLKVVDAFDIGLRFHSDLFSEIGSLNMILVIHDQHINLFT